MFQFDPIERVKQALTIDGASLLSLQPVDFEATRKSLEAEWLVVWIDRYWGPTWAHLSPAVTQKHEDKIADYGESLGLGRKVVKDRLHAAYATFYAENNRRAIAGGHGLI